MRVLKAECRTFTVFLPADHTPYIQLVDDCVGKCFRELIYDQYEKWVLTYDPKQKLVLLQRSKEVLAKLDGAGDQKVFSSLIILFCRPNS